MPRVFKKQSRLLTLCNACKFICIYVLCLLIFVFFLLFFFVGGGEVGVAFFCFSLYSSLVCFVFLCSDLILIMFFSLRIYAITGALFYSPMTDLSTSYLGVLAVEGNTRSAASVCLALSAAYRHDTISGPLRLLCESFARVLKTISNCQVF